MRGKPNVLVTGAAGYVGTLTFAALLDRREALGAVVGLDVRPLSAERRPRGAVWVTGDLRGADLEALLREHAIDVVVHLASVLKPPPDDPDLAYQVDVVGTRRLLRACVAEGVSRLIVTTSGAAYGYHPDNPGELTERDPIRGDRGLEYADHKRLIEEMLAEYRDRHPELEQLVFRPGTIVGPETESPVTALFDRRAILGVWGATSPFVFVSDEDVVACLVKGVLEQKAGVYNLAGDGVMTARQIARRLGKPYLPLPAPLLSAALLLARALGLTAHGPGATRFLRYRPVLSNRHLKEDFGYAPAASEIAFEKFAAGRKKRPRA